ncbi:MAG: DNA primase [Patescibacteria group bacterium]
MASSDVIQQIKARLDIIDVVGEYVRLKQAGQNWKGLCPFHNEKTPSFMVSRERQIWHCFGCNSGGDIFEFIQRLESMDFPEALEMLARRAQVTLDKVSPAESSQRLRLLHALEKAQMFFQEQLLKSSLAQTVRAYLRERQITDDSINTFGIGYSLPEWDKLSNYLRQQGFTINELVAAGLALKSERGPGIYDRFRERLMFPIADAQNRIVGFGGRVLTAEAKEAKYINSPQGPAYNKSFLVYNLNRAKSYIKEAGYAVLVEGYMDVIGVWQAGTKNVVATSGTALTPDQIKLIKRYTNEIRIAFDADLAGRSASERGIDLALQAEMEVKVIILPFGKDPDECARQDTAAWQAAVAQALPIVDYAFKTVLKEVDVATREGKKVAANRLLKAISKLPDPVEQDYYLKQLARVISTDELALRQKFAQLTPTKNTAVESAATPLPNIDRPRLMSERLLALLIKFKRDWNELMANLPFEMLAGKDLSELYKRLMIYYNKVQDFDIDEFRSELWAEADLVRQFDALGMMGERDFADYDETAAVKEAQNLLIQLRRHYFSNELKQLSLSIKDAEKRGSQEELASLLDHFNKISQQLSNSQN